MRIHRLFHKITLLLLGLFMVILLQGCDISGGQKAWSPKLSTEYHAVFLDNGQVFFGRLSDADSQFLQLTDVFYIRTEANKDSKDVKNVLVKRGSEWHGPDRMYLNSNHVTLIEPVSASSKVAELIKESNKNITGKK